MVNPVSFSLFFIILDMSVQKSVEKLDETFESKDKRVVFASGEHPLELYFQGDYDTGQT